jgi:hypothetical protein
MASVHANFERPGLFGLPIHDWSNKDEADKTYANFVPNFDKADAEHRCQLTAALLVSAPTHQPSFAAPAIAPPLPPVAASSLSYCWSHGFGSHSGANGHTRHPGHDMAATIDNMLVAALQSSAAVVKRPF